MDKYISDAGMPAYWRKVHIDGGVTTLHVRAAEILEVGQLKSLGGGEPVLELVLGRPFCPRQVTVKWAAVYGVEAGGYFVINDSLDGLVGYEDAEQFEFRYARVEKGSVDNTPTEEEALITAGVRRLDKQDEALHVALWADGPKLVVRRDGATSLLDISNRVAEELIASGLSLEG